MRRPRRIGKGRPIREEVVDVAEQRTLDTPGVRFRYAVAGDGPPVVLVPGSGGWQLTFQRVFATLSHRYRVFAVDPPGQGGTRIVDRAFGWDADAVAGSLGDFLDAVDLPAASLVGHSWGGGFALRLAQLAPERVRALALLAPGGLDVADTWEFRLMRQPLIGELATRYASAASVRHMLRKSFVRPEQMPGDAVLREAARQIRTGAARRDLLRVERAVRWGATERDLHLVRRPTLILWGDRDRYFPVRLLPRFTGRLPDVEAHVLAGCGHSLHDDCPEQVDPLLTRFLAANAPEPRREEDHDA